MYTSHLRSKGAASACITYCTGSGYVIHTNATIESNHKNAIILDNNFAYYCLEKYMGRAADTDIFDYSTAILHTFEMNCLVRCLLSPLKTQDTNRGIFSSGLAYCQNSLDKADRLLFDEQWPL